MTNTTNTTNTWRVSAPRSGAMAGIEIYNGTEFVCQMSHHPAKRREAADTAARIVATMNRAETHAAQQPAKAVPDGWKLVPVEPTEHLLDALFEHGMQDEDDDVIREAYRAMLAAAPAAPVAQEPVAWLKQDGSDAWTDAKKRLAAAHAGLPGAIIAEMYSLPLYAAPPAAEQPDTVSGLETLIERWRAHAKMLRKDKQQNVADMADDCADELRGLLAGGAE